MRTRRSCYAKRNHAAEGSYQHRVNHRGTAEAVGISTVGQLRRVGIATAYDMVKANNPGKTIPVCYYLYSLQGALDGVHWDALPEKTKQNLLREIK